MPTGFAHRDVAPRASLQTMQKIHVLHHKRILDDVCRSISCGERDSDDEAGSGKPSKARTKSFPFQRESRFSSIEIEPSP